MHDEGVPIALARLVARNRRRYGGYIVHVAMLIYFVAFTGLAFPAKTTVDLQPGQQTTLKSPFGHTWTFTHLGVSQYSALNRRVSAATVELLRDGKRMGTIKSEKRQHVDSFGRKTFEASTEVGIRSDLLEDVYVVYAGSPDGTERASYSLLINPLVGWFWIGGAILTLGGLLTMWPGGPQVKVARRRASIQAGYTVPLAGVAE
jgi:cytochrome c-type biogenesis protein CcmF